MLYGKAIKSTTTHADQEQGKIDFHVGTGGSDTYFRLQKRLTNQTTLTQTQNLLTTVLNRIAQAGLIQETIGQQRNLRYAFWWPNKVEATAEEREIIFTPEQTTYISGTSKKVIGAVENTLYFGTKQWLNYGSDYRDNLQTPGTHDMKALEEILGEAYYLFTHIENTEVRAGSGVSIEQTIGDLWTVINKVREKTTDNPVGAIATSVPEYIAQLVAERMHTILTNYFLGAGAGCTFQTVNHIKTNLNIYLGIDPATFSQVTDVASFPANLNLPLGAAQLTCAETTGTFSYKDNEGITFGINGSSGTAISKIMWPAELCYFGNSPIRVSNDAKVKTDYPQKVSDWEDDTKWSGFTKNSHVVSSTRSVAMQNDINYGTALLKTTVKYGVSELHDNNSIIHTGEVDNIITPTAGTFTLTGVLVGGQNDEMGWNYIRKYTADETDANSVDHYKDFNFVIYDNAIGAGNAGISVPVSSASDANYTMVFDNYDSSKDETHQNDVYVCLEFQNKSGQDFYGEKNLIRKDATFYLVGKLTPSDATNYTGENEIQWPTATANTVCHALPPYNTTNGSTIQAKRVFIQDYMTTANFTIGTNSLRHAFSTVPDLRSAQTSLGLSVDLKWQTGLNFNNVLLGGN